MSEQKNVYRLRSGFEHYEEGILVSEGETVEMTPTRAKYLQDRFVLVGSVQDDESESEPPIPDHSGSPHYEVVKEANAPEVIEYVNALDTLDDLRQVRSIEHMHGRRKTVLRAVEDRARELKDGA